MRKSMRFTLAILGCGVLGTVALSSDWRERSVLRESFQVSPGGSLRADIPDANLTLRRGASDRLEIEVLVKGSDIDEAVHRFEKMNFRAEADGNEVTLNADAVRTLGAMFHGGFLVEVLVDLPAAFDVDLRTGDGDVSVEGLDGVAKLRTGDGDVHVGDLRGETATIHTSDGDIHINELEAPSIAIHSGDGDVTVRRIEGGEVEVTTGDGDIHIKSASGAFRVSTGDGDINIGIDRLEETTLKTGDGDVTIRADSGLRADLDLRGEDVVLRGVTEFSGELGEDRAKGAINGGGALLRASSGDGSVVLSAR